MAKSTKAASKAKRQSKSNVKKSSSRKPTGTAQKPKAKAPRGTELERRWANYYKQRTMLEEVVQAVNAAEVALEKFREEERSLRAQFINS